jgi:hypothetical protein
MEDWRLGQLLLEAFLLSLLVLGGLTVRLPSSWRAHLMYKLTSIGIGIFQDYYEQNQLRSYSSSTIAWIPSVESFMMFFWVSLASLVAFFKATFSN